MTKVLASYGKVDNASLTKQARVPVVEKPYMQVI